MNAPTLPEVLAALERKGHAVFRNAARPDNLNIVGIRSSRSTAGLYDDWVCWFAPAPDGGWASFHTARFTTDPGLPYLRRPINPKGALILVPGQYRGAWKIDLHRGRYPALCQRLGPVRVYRDNSRDHILDFAPESIESGHFGANIHKPSARREEVGHDSAGCQVFQNPEDFRDFMAACQRAATAWGNRFTYTLLEERDLG